MAFWMLNLNASVVGLVYAWAFDYNLRLSWRCVSLSQPLCSNNSFGNAFLFLSLSLSLPLSLKNPRLYFFPILSCSRSLFAAMPRGLNGNVFYEQFNQGEAEEGGKTNETSDCTAYKLFWHPFTSHGSWVHLYHTPSFILAV